MKNLKLPVNFTFIITLLISASSMAATITVKKDGSGDHTTVQAGLNSISAGDTLVVYPGIYNESVVLIASGTASNPIVIMSSQDTTAILDGTGFTYPQEWGEGVFKCGWGANHVEIIGLKVQNSSANGIILTGAENIHVTRCKTYNTTSSGIGAWLGKHITIDQNEVILACNDGAQECITVGGCDSFEIAYNHVHHSGPGSNGGEGIDGKHGTYGWIHHNHVHDIERLGIYVDAWDVDMHHVWVYQNEVHDCNAYGIVVVNENGGMIRDVYVYNNIAYSNANYGFGLENWGVVTSTHDGKRIHFYHNTSYGNGTSGWGGGMAVRCSECDSVFITDNIFSENTWSQYEIRDNETPTNLWTDKNIIYGPNGFGDPGNNSINSNPLMMDPSNEDFSLQSSSPAINQGSQTYTVLIDYDGNPRNDGNPDIGAFEAGTVSSILEVTMEQIDVAPNPTFGLLEIKTTADAESVRIHSLNGVPQNGFEIKRKDSNTLKANLAALGSGIYVVEVNGHRFKVIVM